jgi:hypothetical protein
MLSPIRNFSMEMEEISLTKNLKIIKGELLNSKIQLSRKFKEQVGSMNWELLTSHYIFYFFGEASELIDLRSSDRNTTIKTISGKLGDFFYQYIDGLWFVKDNCCFCNQYFLELIADQQVSITYKDIVTSTATDQFSWFSFSEEELAWHNMLFFKMKIPQVVAEANHQPYFDELFSAEGGIIASPTNKVVYNHPRLYRALFFLNMVRKNGSFITKITFFMMLYECLFTSDDRSIAKRIRERAATLLGGNGKAKKAFKELIFRAYDIRSRNVHGDAIDLVAEKVREIVSALDQYTREILLKVIESDEIMIFTSPESAENKAAFENYFEGLVRQAAKADFLEEMPGLLKPCVISAVIPR